MSGIPSITMGRMLITTEMNISHKLSTYLAAGIPVIVPNTLSNSHLIEERGLGFAVNSLEEANQLVQNMAPESYQEISSETKGLPPS